MDGQTQTMYLKKPLSVHGGKDDDGQYLSTDLFDAMGGALQ